MKMMLSSVLIVTFFIAGVGAGSRLQLIAMSNISHDQINTLAKYFTGFIVPDLGLYNGGQSGVGSKGWLTRYGTGKDVKVIDILGGDYTIEFEKKFWFFVDKDKPVVVVKVIPALICQRKNKVAWLESDLIEVRYKLGTSLLHLRKLLADGEDTLENLVTFQVRDGWGKDPRAIELKRDILDHFENTTRKYNNPTLPHPTTEVCR